MSTTEELTMPTTSAHDLTGPAVTGLCFEHRRETLGIGASRPRLSWIIEGATPGWRQAGYEIEALGPDGRLRGKTGRVESDQSVLVPWPFAPLVSRERLVVRVRAWGGDGQPSQWSASHEVEAGLLDAGDWSACFIAPDWDEDITQLQPGPLLRKEFQVRLGVIGARLYVTALGVFETEINGRVVGDHVMDPGWTSYNHRLRYQTFDITDMLIEGPNAIGALLGDGWYRGRLGWAGDNRNIYGDRLALLAQLEIAYADGRTERTVTDESWRAARGPVIASDIYDGETYDARQERRGWSSPGYDDSGWSGVRRIARDLTTLVAPVGPPVRRIETIAPVAITTSPSGRTIVDFGQNVVGRLRLTMRGWAGQAVTLRHAEVLEGGELCTRPLRTAKATDRYILRGGGEETWEPRFTFHGFRYAEVEGLSAALSEDDIRAVVCHSDLERTGWFECSDPLINRFARERRLEHAGEFPRRAERLPRSATSGWAGLAISVLLGHRVLAPR